MANFDNFWDAIASFDIVDPIEGVISGFANADWRGAFRRQGLVGIGRELIASATGYNSPVIAFKRHAGWSGIAVEQLLKRHGVKIYGRGFTKTTLFFEVKGRQSRWATYMLRRAGVPVVIGYWVPKDATWQAQPRSAEPPVPARYRNLKFSLRRHWVDLVALAVTAVSVIVMLKVVWGW